MPHRLPALALAALCVVTAVPSAHAKPATPSNAVRVEIGVDGHRFYPVAPEFGVRRVKRVKHERRSRHVAVPAVSPQVVGSRPAPCPRRYCGCALSLKLFGVVKPALNIAENWKGFPRVDPAPGVIAAIRGHVLEVRRHIAGTLYEVWDPNSGRGLTRIHARDLSRYTFHNPHGQLAAYNGRPGRSHRRRWRMAHR